jgi:protein-L-isoaspartate(D-aspartate) O-methyltransferase
MAGTIEQLRDFYAHFVVANAGSSDPRLVDAFRTVPREAFVGPGPWWVRAGEQYVRTPSADFSFIYQDVLIALDRERGINNGQPTFHALCVAACSPQPGESVIHVGSGSGYYTAILSALVGATGRVVGYEVDAHLAALASTNLAHFDHARVVHESAAGPVLPDADVIYVNAGVTDPLPAWLDALRLGGRLVLPLTAANWSGWVLLVTRLSSERYAARAVCRVGIIPCTCARDETASARLAAAFETNTIGNVRALQRNDKPDASCWYAGNGWWLSTAPPVDGESM